MGDGAVGGRLGEDGLLDQAGEAVGDALGGPAVEAEDVLVEIGLQVLGADRTMVGAQQPALGEPEDQVDGRQAERGVAPGPGERDRLVGVARGLEPAIARPAVGGDLGGACDVPPEKANQAAGRSIGHRLQAQAAEPAAAQLAAPALDRTRDHGLARGAAAGLARPGAADQGLIGLDPLAERLAVRHDHGAPNLVQPRPSRAVAAKAHLPLQLHGRDPALARRDQIDREKPARQAGLGLLEDGAGEDRVLLAASPALLNQPLLVTVGLVVAAGRAAESPRANAPVPDRPDSPHRCRNARERLADPAAGRGAIRQPWRSPGNVLASFSIAVHALQVKPEPSGELVLLIMRCKSGGHVLSEPGRWLARQSAAR